MRGDTITTGRGQTKAPTLVGTRSLSLPTLAVSPYFIVGRGALVNIDMAKAHVVGFVVGVPAGVSIIVYDNSNNYLANFEENFTPVITDVTSAQLKATIIADTKAALQVDSGLTFADSDYNFLFPAVNNRSISSPSLAVNTSRQASTSQDAQITASVDVTATLNLSGGTSGKVELKYADDSAFTTNVVTVQSSSNGNTGTLTLGLGITQLCTATVTGVVPTGKYYRLVTTNITGTPTYGTPLIQEVLL